MLKAGTSGYVLIVEDDVATASYIANILSSLGFTSATAVEGRQGLAMAESQRLRPDLILLDLRLPTISGLEVCQQLKAQETTRDIPIIVLTALPPPEAEAQSLEAGADDYISKPFRRQELAARIHARLRTSQREEDLRQKAELLRATFQRYVAPKVVDRLLAHPELVELGGQQQVATVLFADLRGFTALANRCEPAELVTILNRRLAVATQAVLEQEGTLDKFTGDGLMALFNAPLPQGDHALRAARAALTITQRVRGLAPDAGSDIEFGIGICLGQVLVGNIGSDVIMNYTAIGQAVNTAKFLQEAAKPGQILVCPELSQVLRPFAVLGPAETRRGEQLLASMELVSLNRPADLAAAARS